MKVRIISIPKSSVSTFADGGFMNPFAHAFGGSLFDNPFGEVNTFDFGGDLKTRRDSIIRNSGVTEEQANAMLFRMLSKEDRGRAIKEHVFGTWTPTYNSNNEIVIPTATTSNRGNVNGGTSQSQATSQKPSQRTTAKTRTTSSATTRPRGTTGLNLYDWYRNGFCRIRCLVVGCSAVVTTIDLYDTPLAPE